MKLVDMKLDKEEKKKQAEPTKVSETSEYPYDLRFTLNENSLKKLGFGPKDFHGKKTVEMNAVADVGVIREIINPKYTWEKNSVELQITRLGLGKMTENKPSKHDQYNEAKKRGPEGN